MFIAGTVFFFLFGTVVGSFLNVLSFRSGASSLLGRSRCLSCGKGLHWFELIPLASFFLQRGRCLSCLSRISWQYPLVELLTGLVFSFVFWKHLSVFSSGYSVIPYMGEPPGFIQLLVIGYELLLWSILVAIAVYDLRHKIIPDSFVYSFVVLSFLYFTYNFSGFARSSGAGQLTTDNSLDFWGGPLLALVLALVWFLSRGRAIGLGDAKLALGMGWFLGFAGGISAFVLGFWFGALYALAALVLRFVALRFNRFPALKSRLKDLTMKSELPLAPFLILGMCMVYLTGVDVTGLSLLLQGNY